MTSPSPIAIPESECTVSVHVLNVGALDIDAQVLFRPAPAPHNRLHCPVYAFLIEHPTEGRVMFDLGIRKNPESTLTPSVQKHFEAGSKAEVGKDVKDLLMDGNVELQTIKAIVWSHAHYDHIGDPSVFPCSTGLVLSKGAKHCVFPPYPEHPEGMVDASAFQGRKIVVIDFDESHLTIGGFRALDYFGDGSFYLFDVPGHCLGHMCALAHVTSSPSTYVSWPPMRVTTPDSFGPVRSYKLAIQSLSS